MSYDPLRKLSIQTVGCRLNQYESEKIASQLRPYGFERVNGDERADLYIINTCTVTHRADTSCRSIIRKTVRQNPKGRIIVIGCYVESEPDTLAAMEGVDLVIGNTEKDNIAQILSQSYPELFNSVLDMSNGSELVDFFEHNRAWVKISDGCNQACSYCIVPKVRGRLRNRPPKDIINDINDLVASGYKEVVLTGVNIGHYSNSRVEPQVKNLAGLSRMILRETDLYRLRLSSIEPQTIRDDLLDIYASANGRICRHVHVPLQSGSARILKLMRRPYSPDAYLSRIAAVREADEFTTVGADVIVGFPGETEDDFALSRSLIESGLIDYLHVFSYSDRKDTPASVMADKVGTDIIKKRNAILTMITDELRRRVYNRQIGRTLEVISEHRQSSDGSYRGVSDNYIKVRLSGDITPGKDIVKVRINTMCEDYVDGNVVRD